MRFEDFYKERQNAKLYERKRFSSTGGRMVDKIEQDVICDLLKGVSKNGRVLDLGCGTGRITSELVRLGYKKIVGVDISEEMLAEAKGKMPRVSFMHSSMFSLPKMESFDACVSVRVIHHLRYAQMGSVFSQVHKALNAGGTFIFDTNRVVSPNAVTKLANLFGRFSYNQFSDDEAVRDLLEQHGFEVNAMERRFFIPPSALNAGRGLSAKLRSMNRLLERNVSWLCASTFWKVSAKS